MTRSDGDAVRQLTLLAETMPEAPNRLERVSHRAAAIRRRRLVTAGAALAVLGGVSVGVATAWQPTSQDVVTPGASAPPTPAAEPSEPRPTGAASTQGFINVHRVRQYDNLSDLGRDSVAVARVTATTTVERRDEPAPTTVTTVNVADVYAGRLPVATITVSQLGTTMVQCNCAPVLIPGRSYVLFLTANDVPGAPQDQYLLTGLTGVYELLPGDTLRLRDAYAPRMPTKLTLTELRRAVEEP